MKTNSNINEIKKPLSDYPQYLLMSSIDNSLDKIDNIICNIKNSIQNSFGFFCKIPFLPVKNFIPVLIINNLTIDKNGILLDKKIEIALNNYEKNLIIKIDDSREIYRQDKRDGITIIEIKESDGLY